MPEPFQSQLDVFVQNNKFVLYKAFKLREGLSLSVQGDEFKYCSPRETIDPQYYYEMEIALIRAGQLLNDDQVREYLPEHAYLWEGDIVAGYVPVGIIQEILNILGLNHTYPNQLLTM